MNMTIGSPKIGFTFGFAIMEKPYWFSCAFLRYPNPFKSGKNWSFRF